MKVHYFYCREHGHFHDLQLYAMMEEDVFRKGEKEKRFTYVETLKIFINKNMERSHTAFFKIDFGKDSCSAHWAKSRKELYKAFSDDCGHEFKPITQAQYLRLRKVAFAIYQRETCMNFDLVKKKQDYTVNVIF